MPAEKKMSSVIGLVLMGCVFVYDTNDVIARADTDCFGMKVQSSYNQEGAFLVETTEARFEYTPGQLKIYQGFGDGKRQVLTIMFEETILFEKTYLDNYRTNFISKKLNIEICCDSKLTILPQTDMDLDIIGHFTPTLDKNRQDQKVLSDGYRGLIIDPIQGSLLEYQHIRDGWTAKYHAKAGQYAIIKSFSISDTPTGIGTTFLTKEELSSAKAGNYQSLSRYAIIWCGQLISLYNSEAWKFLRENRPDQIVLHYISANSTKRMGEDCCFDYDYILSNHPEWLLLKDNRNSIYANYLNKENLIRWDPLNSASTNYNRFYIDIGNPEFQKWAINQIDQLVSGKKHHLPFPYDGIAMDNVSIGTDRWEGLNRKYPNWKYGGTPEDWHNVFFGYLNKVKQSLNLKGYKLFVNHNLNYGTEIDNQYWNLLYQTVDGIATERPLMRKAGQPLYSDKNWLTCIQRHEDILANNIIDWWIFYIPDKPNAQENFLYGYCSWLLTQKPLVSFFYAKKYPAKENIWFKEYELPIGKPVSTRYEKNGCWLRDYSTAKIIVNPTLKAIEVAIDPNNPHFDWVSQKYVTTTTVPPQSGRIFLYKNM